ncbi:MAG: M20/M25/M40 family metallo-hydrolase [Fibrobacteria bacterium]|nr:M20/M25/M40 family metallo-hydrolase [Fibrobacteria bacterium]
MPAHCDDIVTQHYGVYLDYLRKLAILPSVFTQTTDVLRAVTYCKNVFEENLSGFDIRLDLHQNVTAIPRCLDREKDIVYLSAHVDTVDADPAAWDAPFHPFELYEDEIEMVVRGISDCKAGVAFQLFISWLIAKGELEPGNLGFTITFSEEGGGLKTATHLAASLGNALPVSNRSTYLIVLENNMRVGVPPVLCIYDRETSNWVVKVKGSMGELKELVKRLEHWNPICVYPLQESLGIETSLLHQEGRHACSMGREKNLLTKLIQEAEETTVLRAGEEKSFGVVPSDIYRGKSKIPLAHGLVLTNRSFDNYEDVVRQLRGVDYEEVKPFHLSQGIDVREQLKQSPLKSILAECESPELALEYGANIGCSDASLIYNSLDESIKAKVLPVVMGPGTRSQPGKTPPRFTHGKNETFDKKSGALAVQYLLKVIKRIMN